MNLTIEEKNYISDILSALLDYTKYPLLLSEDGMDDEYVLNEILEDYNSCAAMGSSKIVIIPTQYDFVIKLPINGEYCDNGAVFYDKAQHSARGDNYCEEEVYCYTLFREASLSSLVAETTSYKDEKTKIVCYLQPKVAKTEYETNPEENPPSKDSLTAVKGLSSAIAAFSERWLASVCDYYGMEMVNKLCTFVSKETNRFFCDDFYSANYGYYEDGRPVIFDYSGFNG